ncbi:AIPR family protein [Aeromonas caviae]|uniref:AIPR family protein n=1 Tax=Aeromonas caviae TaxID=648 RepID=UPI002B478B19|nr:AIPR family protein [Aeromonas caviae]
MHYGYLISVLDQIIKEAPDKYSKLYNKNETDIEKINQCRARAFIHLYLKVSFGITDFSEREHTLTDKGYDGGIDGYHIDQDNKVIYLIQSKFRANSHNFENKEISLDEILSMEISRILEGEEHDEHGNTYNGKIKQLQREISNISDIARYKYQVVILANLRGYSVHQLKRLTDGYPVDVFDYEKTYNGLLFPVLTGNYFTASDIIIPIDLSNKSSGSKISYSVETKYSECEITVLFVPAIEIAKMMRKYKNAILKYNPRSYLDMDGRTVNDAIHTTIIGSNTNEFALYNNGITMLSEETNINEKIGQKNKAQLRVKNPQIINGGQTSFTLSRILEENEAKAEDVFNNKEVMLKVITVSECEVEKKLQLIDEISVATNKQTPVINADKFSNDEYHKNLQNKVFNVVGLLYERKRGEFSDGLKDGYIKKEQVIERNFFWRVFFASNGKINLGFQKRLFQKNKFPSFEKITDREIARASTGVKVHNALSIGLNAHSQKIRKDLYAKVFIATEFLVNAKDASNDDAIQASIPVIEDVWELFISTAKDNPDSAGYINKVDRKTGLPTRHFSLEKYLRNSRFEKEFIHFIDLRRDEINAILSRCINEQVSSIL